MCEQQATSGNLRNILVAVDGSECSEKAFKFYLERLFKPGDRVFVFHGVDLPETPHSQYLPGFSYYEECRIALNNSDERAKATLQQCRCILKTNPNLTYKIMKEFGDAGQLICKIVKDENISCVIMGSRGRGTVRRTLLGSVSGYVVHHSSCPVCVVPCSDR